MNRVSTVVIGVFVVAWLGTARADEPPRVRPQKVGLGLPMPLVKVGEDSITVKLPATTTGGGGEVTIPTNKETKVFVGVVTDEKKAPDGAAVTRRIERRTAALADLKAGQRVRVTEVEGVAHEIDIMPPPPKTRAQKEKKPADKEAGDAKTPAPEPGK